MSSSILIIYTGGTIGMKQDPVDGTLKPFDFSQIHEEVPELGKFNVRIDTYTFNPLIDSSDVEPGMWVSLAELIQENYDDYDGFVVLHGTDTMAYSASTLSFMLKNLSKPVIFTGSQLPIGTLRTDGKENLVSAIEIAGAKDAEGRAMVPEVAIFFGAKLLRGNRATKMNSDSFDAFDSPNCPPLAIAGIDIRYNPSVIVAPSPGSLKVQLKLDTRVSFLRLHPGITPQVARNIACGEETRAVILETYGSGNAPSKPWLMDIIREAVAMGKILVNISQCKKGRVNMDLYATGRSLKDAGVVSGDDLTPEAALGKLFTLMGLSDNNSWVKSRFSEDLRGEISK